MRQGGAAPSTSVAARIVWRWPNVLETTRLSILERSDGYVERDHEPVVTRDEGELHQQQSYEIRGPASTSPR